MSSARTFSLPQTESVHHGPGCLSGLAAALAGLGIERALLVTGTTLATETDLVDRVLAASGGRVGSVFHETVQHVPRESVLRAAEAARRGGVDGVVTLGGGTPNDTGKAVALALAEGIEAPGDFDARRVRFEYPSKVEIPPLSGWRLPIVSISTTLSAGEFTRVAGISDERRRVKDLYIDRGFGARVAFLDAELTLATPEWLWLSTGVRAVDHDVEALASTNAHPFTDALALHALGVLGGSLRACRDDPGDLEARTQAQLAAWMSVHGLSNVTLGLSHGIGHQLGARNGVPHGYTSCVMMHPTMVFNRDHVGDRQGLVGRALGVDVSGLDREAAGAAGREAVDRLVADLGLPRRLRDVGVGPEHFDALAADALQDMIVATNPRPVGSAAEVTALLRSAY